MCEGDNVEVANINQDSHQHRITSPGGSSTTRQVTDLMVGNVWAVDV